MAKCNYCDDCGWCDCLDWQLCDIKECPTCGRVAGKFKKITEKKE